MSYIDCIFIKICDKLLFIIKYIWKWFCWYVVRFNEYLYGLSLYFCCRNLMFIFRVKKWVVVSFNVFKDVI